MVARRIHVLAWGAHEAPAPDDRITPSSHGALMKPMDAKFRRLASGHQKLCCGVRELSEFEQSQGSGDPGYLLSPVARYVPSPIMIAPVTVLCRRRKVADERMRSPSGPASAITIKSAVVFKTTEMAPSKTN
jgi:hypothetical protein